jgi:hypothetical protein
VCPKGKFLDFHGINCIDECPSEYPHYVEGVYQCIKDCPNDIKLKEDNKCVSFCSDNYPYLNGLICQKDCSGFVNEFENNICVDECPNKYKFYKIKEGIKFCSKECDFALPDGQCVSKCEKVTYYPNRTCLENCPSSSYFVNDNGKILCYEKECPNDYPYHDPNGNNCSNICNDYINITTNECGGCPQNFKIFEDNGEKYCVNDCESLGLFKSERNCFKYCSTEGGEIKMVENII